MIRVEEASKGYYSKWDNLLGLNPWAKRIPDRMVKLFEKNRAKAFLVGEAESWYLYFYVSRVMGNNAKKRVYVSLKHHGERYSGIIGLPYRNPDEVKLWIENCVANIEFLNSRRDGQLLIRKLWREAPSDLTKGTPVEFRTRKVRTLEE